MQSQQIEDKFDPVEFIRVLNQRKVRYLLIGRQAVVQYGASLFSFDYDFWIHPSNRENLYQIAEVFGLLSSYSLSEEQPIVVFSDDEGNKIDIFFVKTMENMDKKIILSFEDVYSRSLIKKDANSDFFIRLPSIDDLILLKQIGETRPKDLEDIEYLTVIREMERGNTT